MTEDELQELKDEHWERGRRTALWATIQTATRELGYDQDTTKEQLIVQIESAKQLLRIICDEHGDNDWPDDLVLYDVLDKHLRDHLDSPE